MEILNYREQPKGGKVIATFDFYLPMMDMTFCHWKALPAKNGGVYFKGPSGYEEINGQKTYPPHIIIGEKYGKDFHKALHDAISPYLKAVG